MIVYQYPKCSTCRTALKWLDAHNIEYVAQDIVAEPPSREALASMVKKSGLPLARFFNTSGESYRSGDFKTKLKTWSEDELIAALAKDGKLIKRPLIDNGKQVLVGFAEAEYKSLQR